MIDLVTNPPAASPGVKLCALCRERPALRRGGAPRCAECAGRTAPGSRLHRRRSRPRPRSIMARRMGPEVRAHALEPAAAAELLAARPRTRGDCAGGERPCPWVSCHHHLYLDINPDTGSIKLNFPDLEPWELKQTCALDVAERGGVTLEEVGRTMNLTRERVRQVEIRGLIKLKMSSRSPNELGARSSR